MKTERQWQKLWNQYLISYHRNPYNAAKRLLFIYAGWGPSDITIPMEKVTEPEELDSGIRRAASLRWNIHHANKILDLFREDPLCDAEFLETNLIPVPPVFKLCTDIQSTFADTPINHDGDLANLLKVLEKNIGTTIAVKYADHGSDHLRALCKDFIDILSFKPFYISTSDYYRNRALLKPVTALKHIAKGIGLMFEIAITFPRNFSTLITNIFMMMLFIFFRPSNPKSIPELVEDIEDNAVLAITKPFSNFANSVALIGRGIVELCIISPFNYLSFVFRLYEKQNTNLIEERIKKSKNIQQLFKELNQHLKTLEISGTSLALQKTINQHKNIIASEIHRKYLKGGARNESTNIKNEYDSYIKGLQRNIKIQRSQLAYTSLEEEKKDQYLDQFRMRRNNKRRK